MCADVSPSSIPLQFCVGQRRGAVRALVNGRGYLGALSLRVSNELAAQVAIGSKSQRSKHRDA